MASGERSEFLTVSGEQIIGSDNERGCAEAD
jgi:hypothetical protein